MNERKEKKEIPLPPHKEIPCRKTELQLKEKTSGKTPINYDSFPRDCSFAYMTPGYYAKGFRIFDVYKTEIDFTEMRSLFFLEDPKQVSKWGLLKKRIPYPEFRVMDLPGTRILHFNNYCLRSLTPESTKSWRKSIKSPQDFSDDFPCTEENDQQNACPC